MAEVTALHGMRGGVVLLVALCALPGLLSSVAAEDPEASALDPALADVLSDLGPEDQIEVIAQFHALDISHLDDLGISVLDRVPSIPAYLLSGPVSSFELLGSDLNSNWLEWNEPVELLLDLSTEVINASRTWETTSVDLEGMDDGSNHDQSMAYGIDGRGVTVVVVDTGVDAGHPDLDYGTKVIKNLWRDNPQGPWVEAENTDASYGHGTHVAGTVAGNGDASAGGRRGVAPAASLIGVGGDWTPVYWSIIEGLEWTLENSRPGDNPDNIRVVSNSWGGAAGGYDPEDSLSLLIESITQENNVVVTFAAGNSGGDNHDGSTITTSPTCNVPLVICVAAAERDGSGIASFSSRGDASDPHTYPDISAPGVNIWATAARETWIDVANKVDNDLYYLSISGTSMATPHVSGVVALMFQAAPSLRLSDIPDDAPVDMVAEWEADNDTRIHEAELILTLTANRIVPDGDNGVPDEFVVGTQGLANDFAQGYGITNVNAAVGLSMTLQTLRDAGHDASVLDAWEVWRARDLIDEDSTVTAETDTVGNQWRGEWAQFTNRSNPTQAFATEQHHLIHVPEEGIEMRVTLDYNTVDTTTATIASLDMEIDIDGDGVSDIQPIADNDGHKEYLIDLTASPFSEHLGTTWNFEVEGTGWRVLNPTVEWPEARAEFDAFTMITLDGSPQITINATSNDTHYGHLRPWDPSANYAGQIVTLPVERYDMTGVFVVDEESREESSRWLAFGAAGGTLVVLAVLAVLLLVRPAPSRPEIGESDAGAEVAPDADESLVVSD